MSDNTTWQPGDRIRCVSPLVTSLEEGKVYTVEYASAGGVKVEGFDAWYMPIRFRKVEEVER